MICQRYDVRFLFFGIFRDSVIRWWTSNGEQRGQGRGVSDVNFVKYRVQFRITTLVVVSFIKVFLMGSLVRAATSMRVLSLVRVSTGFLFGLWPLNGGFLIVRC